MMLSKNTTNTRKPIKVLQFPFLNYYDYLIPSVSRIFIKVITFWRSGGCGCWHRGCRSLEKSCFGIIASNVIKCCPHDHWQCLCKIICTEVSVIAHDARFIPEYLIVTTKKLNIVFQCTSCNKWLPLHTTHTIIGIISEKSMNKYWSRFD